MSKGIEVIQAMITYIFAIVVIGMFIMVVFSGTSSSNIGQIKGTEELGSMAIMYKLITSKDCLSTGRMGILNASLLNKADGGDELNCAYLPNFGWYAVVEDLKSGKKWKFGYNNNAKMLKRFPVTIDYGDKSNPGQMTLSLVYQKDDLTVYMTNAAEVAWVNGSFKGIYPYRVGLVHLKFKGNKICNINKCKKLLNAVTEIKNVDSYASAADFCYFKLEKENDKIKVREFKCH